MREWDFAVNKKGITKYCQQDSDLIYITIFKVFTLLRKVVTGGRHEESHK